jgi:hypothetical protein
MYIYIYVRKEEEKVQTTTLFPFELEIREEDTDNTDTPLSLPPLLTVQLHGPTQTTSPPLRLHKRATLETIPAQASPCGFKRRCTLAPECRLRWRLGQARCRTTQPGGDEAAVFGDGLGWLFEAADCAGEVIERVVEGALRAGPFVWIWVVGDGDGWGCGLRGWMGKRLRMRVTRDGRTGLARGG